MYNIYRKLPHIVQVAPGSTGTLFPCLKIGAKSFFIVSIVVYFQITATALSGRGQTVSLHINCIFLCCKLSINEASCWSIRAGEGGG